MESLENDRTLAQYKIFREVSEALSADRTKLFERFFPDHGEECRKRAQSEKWVLKEQSNEHALLSRL